jgi:erythronate-4-phosphate dehydrogenase
MKILADENIALVHEAFGHFGELRTVPGRSITAAMLADIDALLVRSVTRVDASLLSASPCRFVGTATSGIDHVDTAWLRQHDIVFADAHGCNANSVVDYVLAALAALSGRDGFDWQSSSVGIIGCGAVGSRLAQRLNALDVQLKIHDPFLPESHPLGLYFRPLAEVMQQQIVTLHTPLTLVGEWPTFHMLDQATLAWLRSDAILVNAARGEIIDTAALLARMNQCPGLRVVLDAWEGEPEVNQQLLQRVDIGTPHIAGYSEPGKIDGTAQVQQAFCKTFGLKSTPALFQLQHELVAVPVPGASGHQQWLNQCVLSAYDIWRDHQAMQQLSGKETAAHGFDALRKGYPLRREFGQLKVKSGEGVIPDTLLLQLAALGFA